jgi:hypothetical protein
LCSSPAATTWKRALGLKKQNKDASIALARHLLPTASMFLKYALCLGGSCCMHSAGGHHIHAWPRHACRRKKDHGRAEALLMAAWGLGIRMHPVVPSDMGSTDEDEMLLAADGASV